jgi:hypothetical protein
MGTSNTLEKQAKENERFQKYVEAETAHLSKTAGEAQTAMGAEMEAFYKKGGWSDAKPLTSGSYQHQATASDWSLDHVTKMIEAVRGAVFGGPPAPSQSEPGAVLALDGKGTTTEKPSAAASALSVMAGMEALITNAAFTAIEGILTAFTSESHSDIVKQSKQTELVPGMSLWVTVMENMWQRSDFFSGELIIQNFYIFSASFSDQRGAAIAKFNVLQTLIDEQAAMEAQVKALDGVITNLDVTRDDYEGALSKLMKIQEMQNKILKERQKEINELKQSANAQASVRSVAAGGSA